MSRFTPEPMVQSSSRLRLLVIFGFAVVWMAAVLARVSYLQLFRYREYLERANNQQERIIEISPMRGVIYDRNGRELAMSIPVDSCFANPDEVSDPAMAARLLSHVLGIPAEEIEQKLAQSRSFAWIARKITPQQASRIQALNLRGIYFQKENKRFYPERTLASSVLGYVDMDEHGLAGVEYSLDKLIRGRPSRMLVFADARRRWFDHSEAAEDKGDNVVLTIDETIQYIAEKALAAGIARTHAKGGSVVVQDPNTGQLLAVANWPAFDSNDAGSYRPEIRVDRAVSDAYEPGSIFKTILFSSALQEGVVQPTEVVDCQMGSIVVAGQLIHDHARFGLLSATEILEHSSDVGSIKIALRLGAPKYYDYIRGFGFGQLTGIKLPGENRGLLRPLGDWTASSIGYIAIGQEISVTPVQMISAESAIANGGTLRRPQIVREVLHGNQIVMQGDPDPRRVIDENTSATMREMMEQVILEGTGKGYAQPLGYTAAGKTGTAQKIDPATGRYSKTNYNASFIGYAPVNNPVVTILVNLDSPVGGHEGNATAGPIFKEVAEQVLAYMNVPHDMPELPNLEKASLRRRTRQPAFDAQFDANFAKRAKRASQSMPLPAADMTSVPESSTVAIAEGQAVTVPKLLGQSVRGVTEACSHLGLLPILVGDGIALDQSPDPGTKVLPGTKVMVHFGRSSDAATGATGGSN
ncbi:MAG TPA: penicillin-binding transpeptidase domain-containing protein [Candidatus Acidoferrales bacterium]|nr:penicillin-binding transpeptidase domain-containing protein [Candidatus Acidoferrales bacterium]